MPSGPTQKDRDAAYDAVSAGLDPDQSIVTVFAAALAQARAEGRAEMIQVAKDAWPRAHTYASENADVYRAGDAARDHIIAAMERAAKGGGG